MTTTFHTATSARPGRAGGRHPAGPRPASIEAGAPPEFGGQDSWWSPEHLLLSALSYA